MIGLYSWAQMETVNKLARLTRGFTLIGELPVIYHFKVVGKIGANLTRDFGSKVAGRSNCCFTLG
jgi:hypothetical protein